MPKNQNIAVGLWKIYLHTRGQFQAGSRWSRSVLSRLYLNNKINVRGSTVEGRVRSSPPHSWWLPWIPSWSSEPRCWPWRSVAERDSKGAESRGPSHSPREDNTRRRRLGATTRTKDNGSGGRLQETHFDWEEFGSIHIGQGEQQCKASSIRESYHTLYILNINRTKSFNRVKKKICDDTDDFLFLLGL